ncbi:TPA: hypothetical protein ACIJ16_000670 [Klebsiella aerogenes]|nr:hypothetical protein [Klebsiella aerogenes]HBV9679816.1 hypothetical protein [Klebsiella aerogenes]
MNVYEMEGFLRGKCLPRDLRVNESSAEYLVRKLSSVSELQGEVTALVATLGKSREVSGCPAGVDLQDHLRQLAAENVGLKAANNLALNILNDEETMVTSLWASSVQHVEATTPATDAYLDGIKADTAAPLVSALTVIANSEQISGETVVCDFDSLISVAAGALRDYYAQQLREGAK